MGAILACGLLRQYHAVITALTQLDAQITRLVGGHIGPEANPPDCSPAGVAGDLLDVEHTPGDDPALLFAQAGRDHLRLLPAPGGANLQTITPFDDWSWGDDRGGDVPRRGHALRARGSAR